MWPERKNKNRQQQEKPQCGVVISGWIPLRRIRLGRLGVVGWSPPIAVVVDVGNQEEDARCLALPVP